MLGVDPLISLGNQLVWLEEMCDLSVDLPIDRISEWSDEQLYADMQRIWLLLSPQDVMLGVCMSIIPGGCYCSRQYLFLVIVCVYIWLGAIACLPAYVPVPVRAHTYASRVCVCARERGGGGMEGEG
jgi:hypothetical protein